jgi:hypothetical protein
MDNKKAAYPANAALKTNQITQKIYKTMRCKCTKICTYKKMYTNYVTLFFSRALEAFLLAYALPTFLRALAI